ncbi:MAG: hypothetical protein ACSLEX_01720 [Minisyncoccota bacterium]
MDVDGSVLIMTIWNDVAQFFEHSFFISALKFFLFVYVSVLVVDIILLLFFRGVSGDLKQTLFGTDRPFASRSSLIRRWEKIADRLDQENVSQYKVAVLEADAFADEMLASIGYVGGTMAEKLSGIQEGHLESKQALLDAHHIRNRVIRDRDFMLSHEMAKTCLDAYRAFFDEVELL